MALRRKLPGVDETEILLEESAKFCKRVGLHKDLIMQIMQTDSDWAFILKVDALLETAAKHIVRHGLQMRLLTQVFKGEVLDDFIDSLSINGRTSILNLLEASGLPDEQLQFVGITRLVRNAYAHNIKFADMRLLDLIKARSDRSRLIKHFSGIEKYDESKLVADYERDQGFLRFCIIRSAMTFLFFAYHLTKKSARRRKITTQRAPAKRP
jgi:hypothetical protein